nr:hypothetical protein [Cypionkella sp.]
MYEDVGSAVSDRNSSKRSGLMDAIRQAKNEGAGLLVTDLTRLDRSLHSISTSLGTLQVPLISIRDGGVVDYRKVLEHIRRGAAGAKNISDGTKKALKGRKDAGVVLGSPGDKLAAAKASARVRGQRSDDIVFQIADIIAEDPSYSDLSGPALAKLLNRRGVRSGWNREWTPASVKKPRKAALEVIRSRLGDDENVATPIPGIGRVETVKTPASEKQVITIVNVAEPEAAENPLPKDWGIF